MTEDARRALMLDCLEVAVPMLLEQLAGESPTVRACRIGWWAREAADQVAGHGDTLQYGSKKSGEAAKVFNHLARGLAALAHCPGGVTFSGRHWCAEPHEMCPRDLPDERPPTGLSGPAVTGLDVRGQEGPAGEADPGPAFVVFPSPP